MNWKDVSNAVGSAAPILGGLLGGPAGAAVGSLVSAALGTENTPDAVNKAILTNPDAALKLAELQENSKVQLQQLAVTAEQNRLANDLLVYQAEANDRDSARQLAAKQQHDFVRPTITFILLAGAICVMLYILSGRSESVLKDSNSFGLIGILVGYLFGELKQATAFWFGQTKESSAQSATIAKITMANNQNKGQGKDVKIN
ncbi:hypothetical protein [Serratia phage vB_SmaM_Hera]|uniref:Uncharacterized protein n=2 Tax=Myosmarvirus MTx TaxID=2846180 RepID=A0A482MGW7_9CAUD|nr:hypothetical protein HWC15_gp064 [Serratia phage MTx]QBQ72370.1 hypothetical protein CPT_MTx_064 [Serratia phage MTx]QPX74702.1 hypothetical protein [Serratia phage vB_SmaM_Hera]